MERNYDENIADMLRSIDRNTDSILKHQKQLEKHNLELDRHTMELIKQSAESSRQSRRSEDFYTDLKGWMKEREAVQNNHLDMILHTSQLIDRIIKTNKLKT